MTYFEILAQTTHPLIQELSQGGIQERYLKFGGPGEIPERKPTIPTNARSEFRANRAMGDWAEHILAEAIRAACSEWSVSHFGNAERIAAGESGFKELYLSTLEEVRNYGKRPDILIFDSAECVPTDISTPILGQVEHWIHKAIAAMEVRSSKFEALTYMNIREKDKAAGKRGARIVPSFTVKVEDLRIVYRWIEKYRIPQSYCQVFFDSVYCINFIDIFKIVASGEDFTIESPEKSQGKATIMIPITKGTITGSFIHPPTFSAEEWVTRLGRHDVYVVPKGGEVQIDPHALRSVLIP